MAKSYDECLKRQISAVAHEMGRDRSPLHGLPDLRSFIPQNRSCFRPFMSRSPFHGQQKSPLAEPISWAAIIIIFSLHFIDSTYEKQISNDSTALITRVAGPGPGLLELLLRTFLGDVVKQESAFSTMGFRNRENFQTKDS